MIALLPEQYSKIIHKYISHAPVDVHAIATDIGINIIEDFIQGSGFLIKEAGRYLIYINMTESHERKRFTIAHELSHFFLHASKLEEGQGVPMLNRNGYVHNEEREANHLAADILMPYELLKSRVKDADIQGVQDLAKAFGVSLSAMKIRLNIREKVI